MKIVRKNEAKKFDHGRGCAAFEYILNDKDINVAVVELCGRYPARGRVKNTLCKEVSFIIKGQGKVVVGNQETQIKEGDLVFIEPDEIYYWEGNLTMCMPCTPAWRADQHKFVE